MVKKLLTLLFVSLLAFPGLLVQSAAAQEKTAKHDRWGAMSSGSVRINLH